MLRTRIDQPQATRNTSYTIAVVEPPENATHKQWTTQQKTIVNISSAITYMYVNNDYPESFTAYYNHKQTLDNQTRVLQKQNRYPNIINFRPAWVDTQLADGIYDFKIKPEHLANLIYFCVENSEHQQFLDVVVR